MLKANRKIGITALFALVFILMFIACGKPTADDIPTDTVDEISEYSETQSECEAPTITESQTETKRENEPQSTERPTEPPTAKPTEKPTEPPAAKPRHSGALTPLSGKGLITLDMSFSETKKALQKYGFEYTAGDLTIDTADGTSYLFWSNGRETRVNRIIFSETAEGLKVGDTAVKAQKIYGEQSINYTNGGAYYFYLSGKYQLTVRVQNGWVVGIALEHIHLNYPENGRLTVQSPFKGSFTPTQAAEQNHQYPVKFTAPKSTRECFVQIAESQVGYANGYMSGGAVNFPSQKTDGWSKYGASMDMPTGAWCAAFVSWCGDTAEIPPARLEKLITADMNWADFRDKANYTPKRGDLVYFRYNGFNNRVIYANHIGIVAQYDEESKTVLTVEGNARGGQCVRRAYRLNDLTSDIRGFSAVRF